MEYSCFYLIFWINLPRHPLKNASKTFYPGQVVSLSGNRRCRRNIFWHKKIKFMTYSPKPSPLTIGVWVPFAFINFNRPIKRAAGISNWHSKFFINSAPRNAIRLRGVKHPSKKIFYVNLLIAEINHRRHLFWGSTRKSTGEWKKIDKAATDSGW